MLNRIIETIKGKILTRRLLLFLTGLFLLSRTAYFAVGVRFDDKPLGISWQYLDPELLKSSLLESCFYLHSQPPIFNLFLGIILKIFPGNEKTAFGLIYMLLGLILYLSLFRLSIKLGVSRRVAFILCAVFMISPSSILYENWLFYTLPTCVLLVLSLLFLSKYTDGKNSSHLFLFFQICQ